MPSAVREVEAEVPMGGAAGRRRGETRPIAGWHAGRNARRRAGVEARQKKAGAGRRVGAGRNGFVWLEKRMLKCAHAERVWWVFRGVFGGSECRRARNSAQNKAIAAASGARASDLREADLRAANTRPRAGLEAVWVGFGGCFMARSSRPGEARGGMVGARNRPGCMKILTGDRCRRSSQEAWWGSSLLGGAAL